MFETILDLFKLFGLMELLLPNVGGKIPKLLHYFVDFSIGKYELFVVFGYIDLLIQNWIFLLDDNFPLCFSLGSILVWVL